MARIGIREASQRLGVSARRVQQRIEDGSLPAARVGTQWTIDETHLALATPRRSRPLSARMAWALLSTLAGEAPPLAATERRRLRAYADRLAGDADPAGLLHGWTVGRAQRRALRVADADMGDLRADDRVRPSGVSAPGSQIVSPVVEGYVMTEDVEALVDDYFGVEAEPGRENVVVHVVDELPDITWPVLAADLAEHLGSRENARAAELIRLGTPAGGTA